MNPLDLFMEGGQAIMLIFKLGFIPREKDFKEFSQRDYEKYHKEVGETEGKMFILNPDKVEEEGSLYAFSEMEKDKMLEAADVIQNLAQEHLSENDDETLRFVASVMPYPFSKGSKYEKYGGGKPKKEK